MKKILLALCLISGLANAQVSNLPASMGQIDAFAAANAYFTIVFPPGYTITSPKVELWNNGLKLSDTTAITMSGDTMRFTVTPAQMVPMKKTPYVFVTNNGSYILGSPMLPKIGVAIPTFSTKVVNLNGIGVIRVLMEGEAGDAISASVEAKQAKDEAIAARDSTYDLITSSVTGITTKLPYGSQDDLRNNTSSILGFQSMTTPRIGTFIYDPTDTTSPDDSARVIRAGSKRFKKTDPVFRPEDWGAVASDGIDDYIPIQKMLNHVLARANAGLPSDCYFGPGEYLTSNTLVIKQATSGSFRVNFRGAGPSRTTLKGITASITGKDLLTAPVTISNQNSYLTIEGITLYANGANRCFYANRSYGTLFYDILFYGGEDACFKIGTYGGSEGYSNYIYKCYFNGITLNGGTNNALLQNHQTRFTVIRDIETDGGYYGIDIIGSDKVDISGGKIEGSKRAAIRIGGSYGSEARVSNVYMNPYIGDKNAQYDGTISGIEMALSFHTVTANRIYLPAVDTTVRALWNYTGLTGSMNYTNTVTGSVSGTTATVQGWNVTGGRVAFTSISGSGFVAGETITQATTGATMVLGARIPIKPAAAIRNAGNENSFTGNMITGEPNTGFLCTAFTGTMLTGNYIFASQIGLQASGTMNVTGNRIYAPPGKSSIVRGFASIQGSGNDFGSGISTDWILPTWDTGGNMLIRGSLNLYAGNSPAVFGSDQSAPTTRTDATTKTWMLGLPHYTNAEEPAGMIYATSSTSDNILNLGGGVSSLNGATRISLRTSANTTTVTGTERVRIWDSGNAHFQSGGGTYTDVASASLVVNSVTKGTILNRMTETQRDAISSPAESIIIYNLTAHKYQYWNGTVWVDM